MKPTSLIRNTAFLLAFVLLFILISVDWRLDTHRQYLIRASVQLDAVHFLIPSAHKLLSTPGPINTDYLMASLATIERLSRNVADMALYNRLMMSRPESEALNAINKFLKNWIYEVSATINNSAVSANTPESDTQADALSAQLNRLTDKLAGISTIIIKTGDNMRLLSNISHLLILAILLVMSASIFYSTFIMRGIKHDPDLLDKQVNTVKYTEIDANYPATHNGQTPEAEISGSEQSLHDSNDKHQYQTDIPIAHQALTRLLEEPGSIEPFVLLLKNIEGLIDAISSAIFISSESTDELSLLASTDPVVGNWPEHISREMLFSSAPDTSRLINITPVPEEALKYIYIKFPQGASEHGLLIIKVQLDFELMGDMEHELQEYSGQLANIVYSARLAQLNLRHAQYEERSAISRELHDSLAQSLSYLKIQASRLQNIVTVKEDLSGTDRRNNDRNIEIDDVIQDMRMNLNVAYRHLRDLISTFRISTRGKSFSTALDDSVNEFASKSIVAINVDNRLPAGLLTVAEEIQLLHIIREALSNIIRHSHATSADVAVHHKEPNIVQVTVEDNGIGLPRTFSNDQHHGIIIMQERTHTLNGDMLLVNMSGGGTRLSINFNASNL